MEAVAAVNVVLAALFCLLVHPWPDSVNSAGTVGFPSLSEIQNTTGDTTTSIPRPLVLLYPAVGFKAPCLLTGWVFRGRLLDDIEFIQFVPVFSVWRNSTETVSPTDYFLVADTGSQQELIQLGGDFFQYNLSEPVEVLDDDVLGVKIARRMGQAFRLVFLSQQNSSEPIAFFIRDTSLSTFDTSSGQVNSRLPLVSPLLSSIPSTVALPPSSSSEQLPSTTSQSVDDVTSTSSGASESAGGTSSGSVPTTSSPPPTVSPAAALPVVAIAAPVAGAGVLLVLALALIVVCGALVAARRRQRRKLNLTVAPQEVSGMEQTDEIFTESNLHSEVVYDEVAMEPTGHEVVVTANEAYGGVSSSKKAGSVMTTNTAYGAFSEEDGHEGNDYVVNELVYDAPRF